jgi:hypothetical protein
MRAFNRRMRWIDFVGGWYEIERLPALFERAAQLAYAWEPDGLLSFGASIKTMSG